MTISFTNNNTSNGNINVTNHNRHTKFTGNDNTFSGTANKTIYVTGSDNTGSVSLSGAGRFGFGGQGNTFSSINASNASTAYTYYSGNQSIGSYAGYVRLGSNNHVSNYTGSSTQGSLVTMGSGSTLDNAAFGSRNDRLTSVNGRVGTVNFADGDDFFGSRGATDNFTVDMGAGSNDRAWIDGITDNNNDSSILNAEKIFINDAANTYKVVKAADGKYTIENGSNKINVGSNGDTLLKQANGTYKKLSEWAGATGSTGGTGPTGPTGGTGVTGVTGATEYADNIVLQAKDYGGGTLDALAGNDNIRVKNGVSNVNIKGGLGTEDKVQLESELEEYQDITHANGKFTFKDAAGKTFTVADDVEKYEFNNTEMTKAQLLEAISPLVADANGVFSPTGTATKYKKDIAATAAQSINLAAAATGYNLTGAGKIDLTAYDLAALKDAANGLSYTNTGGGNYTNVKLNGNILNNTGIIKHNGIEYATLKAFIDWFKTQ